LAPEGFGIVKSSSVLRIFDIPKNISSRKVIAGIKKRFNVRISSRRSSRLQFYDTFDWRIYHEGLVWTHDGAEFRLANRDTDTTVLTWRGPGDARFWRDHPAGELQDRLRHILEERAALPLGGIEVAVRDVRILNSDEKTVVRARIEEGRHGEEKGNAGKFRIVKIVPVKGYIPQERKFSMHLQKIGLHPATKSVLEIVAEARGCRPGDYTSKLKVQLDRSMTGQEAAGTIYKYLLDIIERNVQGIRDDIDTEFVHDFRVAVRRTRSGLTQIKGILPKETTDHYGARFAEVTRVTNRLRDLDVYLLSRDPYRAMLNEDLAPALDPLFDELTGEREKEHKAVVNLLQSKLFQALIKDWKHKLADFGSPSLDAKRADLPVSKVADPMIYRRYTRVFESGNGIDARSPDYELHALRISCKKLRYLLEFFCSLYPLEMIESLIKQLKKLQDNLGEFNDLSVQGAELKSFLNKSSVKQSTTTAAAIGALIAKLENRQGEVRQQFGDVFRAFASSENVACFRKLFGKK
jgi:CHAD domain-containing protein